MATERQAKTLEKVVELGRAGKRIVKSKVLRDVGYSGAVQLAPQKVFESKGFLDLCDENGLTEDFLTQALYSDIKGKPKKREKELRLAFQIRGNLKNEQPHGNTFNTIIFSEKQGRAIASRLLNNQPSEESSDRLPDSDES